MHKNIWDPHILENIKEKNSKISKCRPHIYGEMDNKMWDYFNPF